MNGGPILTVVMPNYNHARYLDRAIESVLSQTRPPDEFIILDDGSTDESVPKIEAWIRREPSIHLLRNEKNEGVIAAHQRLFQAGTGDYLYPASADDELLPHFFERAMALAEQYPQAGCVFGAAEIIDENDRSLGVLKADCWESPLYASPKRYLGEYLNAHPVTQSITSSTIYRRDAMLETGGYRPELGSWTDSFVNHAISLRHGVAYTPEVLSKWRKTTAAFSGAGRADPRLMLRVAARAAHLMRSKEFQDLFPEDYVARFESEFRRATIWQYWLGADRLDERGCRESFIKRNIRRLPRVPRALGLLFYRAEEG
jgi:glycosyltransferase involved in cell wall biosynthesis